MSPHEIHRAKNSSQSRPASASKDTLSSNDHTEADLVQSVVHREKNGHPDTVTAYATPSVAKNAPEGGSTPRTRQGKEKKEKKERKAKQTKYLPKWKEPRPQATKEGDDPSGVNAKYIFARLASKLVGEQEMFHLCNIYMCTRYL